MKYSISNINFEYENRKTKQYLWLNIRRTGPSILFLILVCFDHAHAYAKRARPSEISVRIGKYQNRKVSESKSVRIGKVSGLESVSIGKHQNNRKRAKIDF